MFETNTDQLKSPFARPEWLDRTAAGMKQQERYVVLVGVALQIVMLLGMIASHAAPILTGDTLLLRVVPVDPRDLFRGDYVILGYEFSRVPAGAIAGLRQGASGRYPAGHTVYVSLVPEPDGKHWKADKFSIHRPTSGKYLRGKLIGHNRLEFGIESYYVQEGTGQKYERAIRSKKLSAEVKVASDGRAKLRGLRIE